MKPAVKCSPEKIQELRNQVDAKPDSAQARNRLGLALYRNGSLKEAAKLLRQAVEMDSSCVEAWINLGGILLSAWDFQGCIDANTKAADLRPDLMQAHYNRGLGYMYLGDAENMIKCFERVLDLDSQNPGGHYHLAVGLLAAGEVDSARECLDRAMQLGFNPEPDFVKALEKQKTRQDGSATIPTTHQS